MQMDKSIYLRGYVNVCRVYTHVFLCVIYMDKLTIIMSIASSVPTYKVAKNFICFSSFSPLPSNSMMYDLKRFLSHTHCARIKLTVTNIDKITKDDESDDNIG